MSLLHVNSDVSVLINGKPHCTEEAAGVWNDLSIDEQARFSGLSELQIIEAIYTLFFSYAGNSYGVYYFEPEYLKYK